MTTISSLSSSSNTPNVKKRDGVTTGSDNCSRKSRHGIILFIVVCLGMVQILHDSNIGITFNGQKEKTQCSKVEDKQHGEIEQQEKEQGGSNPTNTERKTLIDEQQQEPQQTQYKDVTDDVIASYSSSPVVFVFILGLEGTGRYTVKSLLSQSPMAQYMTNIPMYLQKLSVALGQSLYQYKSMEGIWDVHCEYSFRLSREAIEKEKVIKMKQQKRNLKQYQGIGKESFDLQTLHEETEKYRHDGESHDDVNEEKESRSQMMIKHPEVNSTGSNFAVLDMHTDFSEQHQQQSIATQHRLIEKTVAPNVTRSFEKAVNNMKLIKQRIIQERQKEEQMITKQRGSDDDNNDDQKNPFFLTVNIWPQIRKMGMVSYPNYAGECRELSYPNLDLWYEACDVANVDCAHIYIYRDPTEVLSSTRRRKFNKHVLPAMHMYTTHLKVISSEMKQAKRTVTTVSDDRTMTVAKKLPKTLGCWNLIPVLYKPEIDEEDDEEVKQLSQEEKEQHRRRIEQRERVWKPFAKEFGWRQYKDFENILAAMIDSHLQAAKTANNNDDGVDKKYIQKKTQFSVPAQYEPYLKSMYKAHNAVIEECFEQMSEIASAGTVL